MSFYNEIKMIESQDWTKLCLVRNPVIARMRQVDISKTNINRLDQLLHFINKTKVWGALNAVIQGKMRR